LPVPLRVHGRNTCAEIEAAYCFAEACGYGVLTTEAPWIHREGVLAHQASTTDLLFITLRKSEALFSPSTRYRDLALGPALFHWESQKEASRNDSLLISDCLRINLNVDPLISRWLGMVRGVRVPSSFVRARAM
jgi:hypothetical protein